MSVQLDHSDLCRLARAEGRTVEVIREILAGKARGVSLEETTRVRDAAAGLRGRAPVCRRIVAANGRNAP